MTQRKQPVCSYCDDSGLVPMTGIEQAGDWPCPSCRSREYAEKLKGEPEVVVVYRRWPRSEGGGVIALFPEVPATYEGTTCDSYMLDGGHSAADYLAVVQATKRAREAEYAETERVLKYKYGYNLRGIYKAKRRYHEKRWKEAQRYRDHAREQATHSSH